MRAYRISVAALVIVGICGCTKHSAKAIVGSWELAGVSRTRDGTRIPALTFGVSSQLRFDEDRTWTGTSSIGDIRGKGSWRPEGGGVVARDAKTGIELRFAVRNGELYLTRDILNQPVWLWYERQ